LGDHGAVVDAEPHVGGEEGRVPLGAHDVHHLLKPEIAANAADDENLGSEFDDYYWQYKTTFGQTFFKIKR
jgi:hypothetical protein